MVKYLSVSEFINTDCSIYTDFGYCGQKQLWYRNRFRVDTPVTVDLIGSRLYFMTYRSKTKHTINIYYEYMSGRNLKAVPSTTYIQSMP